MNKLEWFERNETNQEQFLFSLSLSLSLFLSQLAGILHTISNEKKQRRERKKENV